MNMYVLKYNITDVHDYVIYNKPNNLPGNRLK